MQRQKQLVGDIAASSIKANEPANTHINAKCTYTGYLSLSRDALVYMDFLGTSPRAGGLEIPLYTSSALWETNTCHKFWWSVWTLQMLGMGCHCAMNADTVSQTVFWTAAAILRNRAGYETILSYSYHMNWKWKRPILNSVKSGNQQKWQLSIHNKSK